MRAALLMTALTLTTAAHAIDYPPTRTDTVVDDRHGIKVADPYRWLEGDVRSHPEVRAWVDAENAATQAYLATLPGRAAFKARLTALWNYEKTMTPVAAGPRLFYRHNSGLQNQYVLFTSARDGSHARPLIDPNGWSKDGATALAEWEPSPDGAHVVYTVQDGGTDWRTIRVVDAATGAVLPDTIEWAKFSGLAWDGPGHGFFYSRYPATPGGRDYVSAVFDHMVYYHRLGTPQSADRLVFRTPEHTGYYNAAETTADGRWLVLLSSSGSDDRYEIHVVDLTKPDWTPRLLVPGRDHDYRLAGSRGDTLYFVTNRDAPRYRVLAFDTAHGDRVSEIVPQGSSRIDEAALVGDRLVVSALVDAKSALTSYPIARGSGMPVHGTPIALPGIGSASGLRETRADDPDLFYSFAGFATPSTVYRWDARTGQASVFSQPKTPFEPADYETVQVFAQSKDGTRVPIFVTRRRGLTAPAPTILYGYGGFNISITPSFSPAHIAWMEAGGVWAVATIRGGGEYGTPWHDAGKLFAKQNVFDDFIAAGEYLKRTGVTSAHGLAIQGGSNGGLLVGAVTNQRPGLFAAALPAVGVMDMTRFHLFTEGRTWTDDYGDPDDPKALRYILTYSPLHTIRSGTEYPAIMVTTADTDDRVVPGHSFKYTAALQAASIGDKPHLIRVETRAGHGSGKPTDKIIEETADEYAFAARWTGLAAN